MNFHSTGSVELDRELADRRRIHAAWGIKNVGHISRMPPLIHNSGGSDHFVGVTKMVDDDIRANFKTREITRGGVRVKFGRIVFRLMTALLAAKGPLTERELIGHIYDAPRDGVDISSHISKLHRGYWSRSAWFAPKLPLLGLRIVADQNRGYTIARD
jgi:hypothetical protein